MRGTVASLQISATDPDGNTLSYSATGLPLGLTISSSTGLISGTVSSTAAATNAVVVHCQRWFTQHHRVLHLEHDDGQSRTVLSTPVTQSSVRGSTASLQIIGSDPDGNTLTYSATALPAGLTINSSTGLISGTVSTLAITTTTVGVTVSDGSLSATASFTWNTTAPSTGGRISLVQTLECRCCWQHQRQQWRLHSERLWLKTFGTLRMVSNLPPLLSLAMQTSALVSPA